VCYGYVTNFSALFILTVLQRQVDPGFGLVVRVFRCGQGDRHSFCDLVLAELNIVRLSTKYRRILNATYYSRLDANGFRVSNVCT
jgi:hypothetical protein